MFLVVFSVCIQKLLLSFCTRIIRITPKVIVTLLPKGHFCPPGSLALSTRVVFLELVVFWWLSSCKTLPHLSLWDAFRVGPVPALPSKHHKHRKCSAMFS